MSPSSPVSSRCCFNPRPHAGGDAQDVMFICEYGVSIHAPTRGATSSTVKIESKIRKFQSTPPRGGRHVFRPHLKSGFSRFQSTPPRGGRPVICLLPFDCAFQSTPPRGGRPVAPRGARRAARGFQSTPPRGGRRSSPSQGNGIVHRVSIHAPTRGATPSSTNDAYQTKRFNPRPHAGGDDLLEIEGSPESEVSIHAPTRGATCPSIDPRDSDQRVSIHAPTRGATSLALGRRRHRGVSIHAPTRGATCASWRWSTGA